MASVIGRGKLTPRGALLLGYAGIIGGAWLLHEVYERRGKSRPFLTKFLPGG